VVYHAHGFVDGAYLRQLATQAKQSFVNPQQLVYNIVNSREIQSWGSVRASQMSMALTRVIYYDARPDDDSDVDEQLKEYWDVVELLNDTELGFGSMRGGTKRRPPRQKGVDTLIAVDMLVGAFTKLFSVAVLIAGDADFVPVINEVKRRGVMVVVGANASSIADDLKRAADRFFPIGPGLEPDKFPPLTVTGRVFSHPD